MVQNIDVLLYMEGRWVTKKDIMNHFDINRTATMNHFRKLSRPICYQGNVYKLIKKKKGRKVKYKIKKR